MRHLIKLTWTLGSQFYPASSKKHLLSRNIAGYNFKGTTDTIVVDSGYIKDRNISGGIIATIEKKKIVEDSDTTQAILELVTASYCSNYNIELLFPHTIHFVYITLKFYGPFCQNPDEEVISLNRRLEEGA